MNDSDPVQSAEIAEFWRLTQAYCNGTQTGQERDRLEAMLWNSAELQARYLDYLTLHADLKCALRSFDDAGSPLEGLRADRPTPALGLLPPVAGGLGIDDASSGIPLAQCRASKGGPCALWLRWSNRWVRWTAAATAALVLLAIWLDQSGLDRGDAPRASVNEAVLVARLQEDHNWVWGGSQERIPSGTQLKSGQRLELTPGMARLLLFYGGTTMLAEGPAVFDLLAGKPVNLERGTVAMLVSNEDQQSLSSPIVRARPSSGKEYEIVPHGLREDSLAYIDRPHQWNGLDASGIPAELLKADYIKTSNYDDLDSDFELQVTLEAPATMYVFFDDRAKSVPAWLTKSFTNTGTFIGLDTVDKTPLGRGPGDVVDVRFSVWKRHVGPGTVLLGCTGQTGVGHYGVAVVADATKSELTTEDAR